MRWGVRATRPDRPGALAAAIELVPLAYTYDHRRLGPSLSAATAGMSERYGPTYTRDFNRRRRAVVREQIVAHGVLRGAGVVHATGDDAVDCLLYVDEVLEQVRGREDDAPPEVVSRRVRVAMVRTEDTWKIDGLTHL